MRTHTDYHAQRNRCHKCAHRVEMHRNGKGRCEIITGDGHTPELDTLCECRKVVRNA